ncbi:hypothetical protein TorRG33x02_319140 [Trema orientale]|uniref:Pollen Ole e 1 allergen and extensin family protein n=1 Tax=Trema orientale TaxID=63057 RepID=A0A2P5BJF2_TREOI|nr:hypothetical protein TorRG33x02_319140 [Trema orientale]
MARSFFCSVILLSLLIVVASAVNYENGPKPEVVDDQQKQGELTPQEPEYPELEAEDLEDELLNHDESFNVDHIPIPTTPNSDHYINNYLNTIGVQGIILCKSGDKYNPLVGAVTRITCLAKDENGYERAPFSLLSHKTDERGFFLVTWSLEEVLGSDKKSKLKECKVFLQESPLGSSCKVPTDVNDGVSGALLSSFRFLPEKVMALYTVGPFIYTSEPNYSVPNGNY